MAIRRSDNQIAVLLLARQNGGILERMYDEGAHYRWRPAKRKGERSLSLSVNHCSVTSFIRSGIADVLERDSRGRPTKIKIEKRGVKSPCLKK